MISGWDDESNNSPRMPAQAGRFYPGEKTELSRTIDKMLAEARDGEGKIPRAVIVPHAGYQFSGPAAAQAYKNFQQAGAAIVNRVILLATSHYTYVRGVVLGEHPYQTPLGVYPVDTSAVSALQQLDFPYIDNRVAAAREHSDEVQIPFLQKVLPQAWLVPVIVGDLTGQDLASTAQALATVVDERTVIVASSDFTHYGRNFDYTPKFDNDIRTGIYQLDQGALDLILRGSSSGFADYIGRTGATICGANPITLLLKMFEINQWPVEARVLTYYTSGDLTGDWDHSVSYAAIRLGTL